MVDRSIAAKQLGQTLSRAKIVLYTMEATVNAAVHNKPSCRDIAALLAPSSAIAGAARRKEPDHTRAPRRVPCSAEVPVTGRTRWAVYHPDVEVCYVYKVFHVDDADPPAIVVVNARQPISIARSHSIGRSHGLDLDLHTRRLFCACDGGMLITRSEHIGWRTRCRILRSPA